MKITRISLLILLSLLIFTGVIWAQSTTITVTGNWSVTIGSSDLVSGAGSDLTNFYESTADAVIIDVDVAGAGEWSVDVKKVDSNWHSNFQLFVKRTSDGSGPGSGYISGGTSYQEVTDTNQSFFSGAYDRSDIDIQLKLDNVSVQIPADTYTTTVTYTVTDI